MINTSFSDIQVIGELIKNCTFYNDGVDQLKLSPILSLYRMNKVVKGHKLLNIKSEQ